MWWLLRLSHGQRRCYIAGVLIEYVFKLDDGRAFDFQVETGRVFDAGVDALEHPFWTRLEFQKCTICPLSSDAFRHCPAAMDAQKITETFKSMLSYEQVALEVRTPERSYLKRCDAQTGLRALFGLVMATSGCPILSRLKGLAKTHLPCASMEETIFRTAGAYLIQQFVVHQQGGEPDWELRGLSALYEQLQEVNRCFKGRIDAASERDANMKALGSLVFLSMGVAFFLDAKLAEMVDFTIDTDDRLPPGLRHGTVPAAT